MNTKKQNKKKKGFTLIELIIVIAIIAILAAIAIPNFLSIQRKARVKADVASAKTIYDATSALVSEGKIVPVKSETITLNISRAKVITGGENGTKDAEDLTSYLQTIPVPESDSTSGFVVTITSDDNNDAVIQVKIGTKDVYPKAVDPYQLS
ncbi:prepilin-type N-terminal cleavage/methylation domain-containing protein [Clostridium sp. B9]|uniref:prepilin-type N-terminal cleavage/methylation domain-containing protein n=1 Tax=Clostridium sp. B9 TaxID=3423224 RepID=UPI003D2EE3E0